MHVTYPHPTPRPKFSSVSLYDEPFLSYAPIFGKRALNAPKIPLTCSRSKAQICMLHTHKKPRFSSVSLYDERFSKKLRFWNSPLVTMYKLSRQ